MRKIFSTFLTAGLLASAIPAPLVAGEADDDAFSAPPRTFPGGHKVADQFPHRFTRQERSEFARVETAENEPAPASPAPDARNSRRYD